MKTGLLLLAALLLGPWAWGQGMPSQSSDTQSEANAHARIEAERQQQTTLLDAEDSACLSRFAVTDCQNGVAQRRRAMLARLKREEVKLNDAMRQQRAQEQRERIQEKADESAARRAEAATLPVAEDRQKILDEKVRNHPQPAPSNGAAAGKVKAVEGVDPQVLADKRKVFEDKQKAVASKRQDRDKRLKEQGPAKATLPIPP